MFAIVEINNKQYKIKQDSVIRIEKIDNKIGETVKYENVLALQEENGITVGNPFIKNTHVIAEIIQQGKDKKIRMIKFNRRKHSMKTQGHRQCFTDIKIKEIN